GLFDEEAGIFRSIYRNRNRTVYSRTAFQNRLYGHSLNHQSVLILDGFYHDHLTDQIVTMMPDCKKK
ncbi:hypothetical protein, partial [Endozoicomonas sp. YOMI1]|uniref:hypothetical protein n=1 Tax=Endozoicomonas sp. YOMI1 TaxID=2828739 RepID=UPI002147D710